VTRPSAILCALALILVAIAPPGADPARGQPTGLYLFDLLKRPAFRQSWDRLFDGATGLDPWIRRFSRGGNGVAGPSQPEQAGGRRYVSADVCKPHDCGDNQLYVLFTADGARAWAVLRTPRGAQWFGAPGDAERTLLGRRLAE